MGLPEKPENIDGREVEKICRDGRIQDIADYCESDVVNSYRVWLRHELFQGRLTNSAFEASEANLQEFIKARANTKPHLAESITRYPTIHLSVLRTSSHSGRRTFATRLNEKRVGMKTIQRLMGHRHIGTTAPYCEVSDAMMRNAVELV